VAPSESLGGLNRTTSASSFGNSVGSSPIHPPHPVGLQANQGWATGGCLSYAEVENRLRMGVYRAVRTGLRSSHATRLLSRVLVIDHHSGSMRTVSSHVPGPGDVCPLPGSPEFGYASRPVLVSESTASLTYGQEHRNQGQLVTVKLV
jgi:hypothetical protein